MKLHEKPMNARRFQFIRSSVSIAGAFCVRHKGNPTDPAQMPRGDSYDQDPQGENHVLPSDLVPLFSTESTAIQLVSECLRHGVSDTVSQTRCLRHGVSEGEGPPSLMGPSPSPGNNQRGVLKLHGKPMNARRFQFIRSSVSIAGDFLCKT